MRSNCPACTDMANPNKPVRHVPCIQIVPIGQHYTGDLSVPADMQHNQRSMPSSKVSFCQHQALSKHVLKFAQRRHHRHPRVPSPIKGPRSFLNKPLFQFDSVFRFSVRHSEMSMLDKFTLQFPSPGAQAQAPCVGHTLEPGSGRGAWEECQGPRTRTKCVYIVAGANENVPGIDPQSGY